MVLALEEVEKIKVLKARAIHKKFLDYLWSKKGRIIFACLIAGSFYHWGNYLAWIPGSAE